MDHYGLAQYLAPFVPVYIGEAARRILKAASAYVPNGHAFAGPMIARDFGIQSALKDAALSHSMWRGYLQDGYTRRVVEWLKKRGILWETIHTSGHTSVADPQRFSAATAPRKLVPIHSFETGRFAEFFDNVVQKHDGVWWEA